MPKSNHRRPISTKEAGDRLGLSDEKIRKDIESGDLAATRLRCGKRHIYRIEEQEFSRYKRRMTGQA